MQAWVLIPITAIFLVAFALGLREVVRRRVYCPREKTFAEVDVVQRYQRDDKPVRVRSCNLLSDPEHVDCGQDCLRHPM